ncbi:hypothetical protein [Neobacillus niacini]|uniref:hypothetical protein n=1 Tax=Neobacillus niacini TaxID=86668 RepID=UPI002861BBD0|nr:hypothetical protein [Neobacillus niacini]MDR7001587.1 hypothetical protein [Neobacillus niacini]
MRCSVLYSKKGDIYEVKIDNPFAEPYRIDAAVFREFLRKHGHGKDGIPMSGMINVYRSEFFAIL